LTGLPNSLPKLDAQEDFIVEFFADCVLENGHVFVDKITSQGPYNDPCDTVTVAHKAALTSMVLGDGPNGLVNWMGRMPFRPEQISNETVLAILRALEYANTSDFQRLITSEAEGTNALKEIGWSLALK
jgi:hypothetical protein